MTTSEDIQRGVDAALAKLGTQVPPQHPSGAARGSFRVPSDRLDSYTRKALQTECDLIISAPDGDQNNTINRAAFNAGTLVATGALSEAEAREALLSAALAGNHPERRARPSIESGLHSGMQHPRTPWPPASHAAGTPDLRDLLGGEDIDWSDIDHGYAEPEEPTDGPGPGKPDDQGPEPVPGLIPEEFWAARPELQHIRQAGHSRTRSGDVALLSVLTRLSSLVSHRIRADTGIAGYASLNLFGGIIGPSGIGKSTGVEVADRLMPAPPELDFRDGLPLGSGEGIAEVFMGMVEEETGEVRKGRGGTETPVTVNVRKQVRHNAFFYVDEGATITRLMKERSGSTLGETLRSAAVGQTLGQTNASKDTSRYIPSGSYSLGLLVGFQPETVAPLFEEVAEGTPQRFVWVQVIDPSIPDVPPTWPGELHAWREAATAPPGDEASRFVLVTFDEAIRAELRAADLAKVRGQLNPAEFNQLDSQAPVMRVKLASLLAILSGRRHVNPEDWALARMLWEASCSTRDAVLAYTTAQRRAEQERRTIARIEEEVRVDHAKQLAEEKRSERAVERLALRIAVLTRDGGPQTRKTVRAKVAGRDKRYLVDAFAYAVLREWVVEAEGKFVPGPVPPS
ncbi:hypothetical protein [Streptomyces sp. DH12]|uniref:hypothetical protein n=1 Tax=Streptomyces sp. DH12 TaxID=2857010 RepID=UPI001E29030C|nr:hypothetical protein [Streptomyces sp. DH12]